MNCYGSGFITILIYALGETSSVEDALLTEASDFILTENSIPLLVETV